MKNKQFLALIFGWGLSQSAMAALSEINLNGNQAIDIDVSQVSNLVNAKLIGESFHKNGSILLDESSTTGFQWLSEPSIGVFWRGHQLKTFSKITESVTFVFWDSPCTKNFFPSVLEIKTNKYYQAYRRCSDTIDISKVSRITLQISPGVPSISQEFNQRVWGLEEGELELPAGHRTPASQQNLDIQVRVESAASCSSNREIKVLLTKIAARLTPASAGADEEPSAPGEGAADAEIPAWIHDLLEMHQGQQELHQFLMSLLSSDHVLTFHEFAAQVQGLPTHADGHQAINLVKLLNFVRSYNGLERQICQRLYPSS